MWTYSVNCVNIYSKLCEHIPLSIPEIKYTMCILQDEKRLHNENEFTATWNRFTLFTHLSPKHPNIWIHKTHLWQISTYALKKSSVWFYLLIKINYTINHHIVQWYNLWYKYTESFIIKVLLITLLSIIQKIYKKNILNK